MKYVLTLLLTLSCCSQGFCLTADQLAGFLSIHSWVSEVQLPRNSFTIEVLEFSDGKVGKAICPAYNDSADSPQPPSTTTGTPIVILWKPEGQSIKLTVTLGSLETGTHTRPGLSDAFENFHGPAVFMRGPQSIKEGDYILGGEPLEHDGTYKGTDDIKDYKRGLLLRVSMRDIEDRSLNKTGTVNQIMQRMQDDAERDTSAQPELRILGGFFGAEDSWRDVTATLQEALKQGGLHVSWQQPYDEMGGDPAFGKTKTLLISYRVHGKSRIAAFQEGDIPIGIQVAIP